MKQARAVVLVGVAATLLSGASARRKLWELDLAKLANHRADHAAYVWGIRFSPDETKVAIGFGDRWNSGSQPGHVVVLAVDKPQTVLHDFEIDVRSSWPSEKSIEWSPSGSTLLVNASPTPVMLRLTGEAPCKFPEDSGFGGFLGGDRMVIVFRHEVRVLAPDCSLTNGWLLDGGSFVRATSPEQDLLAIERFAKPSPYSAIEKPSSHSVVELVDARSQEVKQRWTDILMTLYGFVFSDQGKCVCSGNWPKTENRPRAACWDIQTGARVAENDKVALEYWGGIAGAGGDLLAMTDYTYTIHAGKFWEFLDMEGYHAIPRRRVIWNVRTGKEIASWGDINGLQQKELQGRELQGAKEESRPTVLSLSSTGKHVAEGGSGKVSVYAVNP
jgi:hypothetical protein